MDAQKLEYFATSLGKRLTGRGNRCPDCGSARSERVDRKYLVTALERCAGCQLLFRTPTDSSSENRRFYQRAYTSGFTTALPSDEALAGMMMNGFNGADHDYSYFISILERLGLGRGDRLFDFGCSWGYGSYQFAKAGFEVTSYEISEPRAAYAREKLGLNVLSMLPDSEAPGHHARSYDCFFSSHVIEHVPRPSSVIRLARALLRPGGYFVAITPNGSVPYRERNPDGWHQLWGKVHPNLIDDAFWVSAFADRPMMLGTSPLEGGLIERLGALGHSGARSTVRLSALDGGELVCIARL